AYGLRDLKLYDPTVFEASAFPFQEILLHQLEAEAQELISRGIKRDYLAKKERLSSPKGRFDFTEMALQGGMMRAEMPCRYHIRSEDCLPNQVLLAGLKHGSRLTDDLHLRTRLRRKAALIEEKVSVIDLDREAIRRLARQTSRLTKAYSPAFEIIKLLMRGQGTSLSSKDETIPLPGFLFDMNRFFQQLMARVLTEWLEGFRIEDERVIRGMIDYVPGYNPRNRRSPLPRPDIVVMKGQKVVVILDAKYRDLWENALPREMLYQLAIYALSGEANSVSTILYPTMDASASEAHLEIREPHGSFRGKVVLRPVNLMELEQLVEKRADEALIQRRRDYANKLAFGRKNFIGGEFSTER
ncbi:MAG: restriction endonuclease, partial [bacterium]